MTSNTLKAQIDSQITNETLDNSISPAEVGSNLKAVVDFVTQEIETVKPKCKTYIAKILVAGSPGSQNVSLEVYQNDISNFNLVITSPDQTSCFLTEDTSENFLTSKSVLKVSDNTKTISNISFNPWANGRIDSLNQIQFYGYYNGGQNLGILNNVIFELLIYPE